MNMHWPEKRTINQPKQAKHVCFRCKSDIVDNPVVRIDPFYAKIGRTNYFHAACAEKQDIEFTVYKVVQELKKSVRENRNN